MGKEKDIKHRFVLAIIIIVITTSMIMKRICDVKKKVEERGQVGQGGARI